MNTFLDLALSSIARGWHVFPLRPRTKDQPMCAHAHYDASNEEARIRSWWAREPNGNVAIAPGAADNTVLDVDTGLTDEDSLRAFCKRYNLPETFAVRTGKRPDYRVQLYYSGAIRSFNHWEVDEFAGDVRGTWGYVLAAGSIHPESGEAYTVLWDKPIAPLPDWARALFPAPRKDKDGKPLPPRFLDEGPIDEWRNDAMIRLLGKARGEGADDDKIREEAVRINEERMIPPLDERELERLIANACKFPIGEPEAVAVLGGSAVKVVDTSRDMPASEKKPRPIYPDEVWEGTPYGEFAEISTHNNFIPKKFFSESMRTVVGALVGDQLRCPIDGVHPRAFTIRIAPAGTGKGTSDGYVRKFFDTEWDGLKRSGESRLLWHNRKEFAWRSRGIGAQMVTPASAPGLIKAIQERRLKKDETANPLEHWKPLPRIITLAEEVRQVFANFQNEATGAGLESVLCELYDRNSFTATATKDREPESGELMYSLCGGITPEGWNAVFSKSTSTESGFLSRVNIVGTEETRTVGTLDEVDFTALRRRFLPIIYALESSPCDTPFRPRPAPA